MCSLALESWYFENLERKNKYRYNFAMSFGLKNNFNMRV